MNVITLTTDFGTRDWFVGTMKGVILGVHPGAHVVDLTHEVPPGDIRAGAFALASACPYFPEGTIHVAVVDPGVGGTRKPIAVRTRRGIFIAPDNGLLTLALQREEVRAVREVTNKRFFRGPLSHTFHGRDLFAPVAAHLSKGAAFTRVGPRVSEWKTIDFPQPSVEGTRIRGEIVYVDQFGNAISNIPEPILPSSTGLKIRHRNKVLCTLHECYEAVPAGQVVAVVGSSGFVEIAVNGGSASKSLNIKSGDPVSLVHQGQHSR